MPLHRGFVGEPFVGGEDARVFKVLRHEVPNRIWLIFPGICADLQQLSVYEGLRPFLGADYGSQGMYICNFLFDIRTDRAIPNSLDILSRILNFCGLPVAVSGMSSAKADVARHLEGCDLFFAPIPKRIHRQGCVRA